MEGRLGKSENDITERRKSDGLLKESEERCRILIQTLPYVVYEVDAEGRFIFVSNAVKQLGYVSKDLIGKHFKEIVHPDDFEVVSRFIVLPKYRGKTTGAENSPKLFDERRTGERMTQHFQIRLLRKSQDEARDDYCYCEIDSTGKWDRPVEDKDKNFLGSIGIIQEITARKRAEEALRESEEKYRFLFENIPLSVAITTLDGRAIIANRGSEEVTGYTKEEFSALKDVSEMYVDRVQRKQLMARLQKERKVRNFEAKLKRKDGIFYQALMNVDFIELHGEQVVLTTVRDITEHKKAEEALRENEEKFRGIVDNIGIGVTLISPGMEILFLNNQMKKWNPHIDLKEKHICYRAFNNPPRERICSYCPAAKTLKDGLAHEYVTETPMGGQALNYKIISSPIKNEAGRVIAIIKMMEDITERKKMEDEAQKRLRELEIFYKASIGREERIIELKKEIEILKKELGK
ncbi:MAG: PAS domain S-box protein [Candidatus Firestonebacteria bacterium]